MPSLQRMRCGSRDYGFGMKTTPYGRMADGTEIVRCEMSAPGIRVSILTCGGIIETLEVPDRSGRYASVVLGLPSLADYLGQTYYFGAILGRYANRIAKGRFALDGRSHQLACNDGPNALHGGVEGFNRRLWTIEHQSDPRRLQLRYVSAGGEEGYPGMLTVSVSYVVGDRSLRLEYSAQTDAPTILNLSNHTYWNLAGEGSGSILDHELTLHAERYTPVDATQIPTGILASVEGTAFDFRRPTAIGARIGWDDPQLRTGTGYDQNWVLKAGYSDQGLRLAAQVHDPASGRRLDVLTDQPGIQFYSGNQLDGTLVGIGGKAYGFREGMALETQHFPDSPNHPEFPSTVLRPGEVFRSVTVFRFPAAA